MIPPEFGSIAAAAMRGAWAASLAVVFPALLLLALGRIPRFPARVRWWIGAILVVRLLLPGLPGIAGAEWIPSAAAFLQEPHAPAPLIRLAPAEDGAPSVTREARAGAASPAGPATSRTRNALPLAWCLGTGLVGAWVFVSHALIRRRIGRTARPCQDARLHRRLEESIRRLGLALKPALLVLPGLSTVALSGWIRPRILVPEDFGARFTDDEIRGVFLHELAHVKRRDVPWSWLALAACALHWFNPLVWLVARRFRADRELECDRQALQALEPGLRHHLGEALLKTLEAGRAAVSPALIFFSRRPSEIRTRILMIARPLLSPLWIRCLSLLTVPALVLLSLKTASADGEKPPAAARDGEGARKTGAGARDGEGARPAGAREGEGRKEGAREGATSQKGAREGERSGRTGSREGETAPRAAGTREGEAARRPGPRDGEARKTGPRDGEGAQATRRETAGSRKSARTAPEASGGNPVILRVTEKGESILVDGEKIEANRLRAHLSEFLPANAGRPVRIEADDDVPYKAVMGVLDAARDNGAKRAMLAERPR